MADEQDSKPLDIAETEFKAGRPFVFNNAGELAMRIQGYFDLCDSHIEKGQVEAGEKSNGDIIFANRQFMTKQKVYTLTGLARHLGVSRDTIRNYRYFKHYSNDMNPDTIIELIRTIEDAVQRVEEFNEAQLHKSGISNGVKFNLTNNFGWQDKQIVETKSIEEDLDELDDPKINREDMAAHAAEELERQAKEKLDVQQPPTEISDEPGSPTPQ